MKQADIERINRLVINPLSAIYGAFPAEMADMLIEDLAEFDNGTLESAVVAVRRTRISQPRIAHIVQACVEARNSQPSAPKNEAEQFVAALGKRTEDARRRAAELTAGFYVEELMQQAIAEGWERELRRYVYGAAWLQSQYGFEVPNPGFDSMALCTTSHATWKARVVNFVRQCKRRDFALHPPAEMVEEWRELARLRAERKRKDAA